MKRRLFSQADGTNTFQDLKDIGHDFFENLKHEVNKFEHITIPIIDVLQYLEDKTLEGSPIDKIIDRGIEFLPDGIEPEVKRIYEWIQASLPKAIDILTEYSDLADDAVELKLESVGNGSMSAADRQSFKHKLGSILLGLHNIDLSRVETDTIVQNTYRLRV